MSERPTPETDAEHAQFKMGGFTLDFCQKLERERDEARKEAEYYKERYEQLKDEAQEALNNMQDQRDLAMKVIARLERERDEARQHLRDITEYGTEEINAAVELRQLLAAALVERDEAREEANRLDGAYEDATNYYARIIELTDERDEAREALARITEAAQAVVDRWEQPAWKDTEPTGSVIYRLRDALGKEAE